MARRQKEYIMTQPTLHKKLKFDQYEKADELYISAIFSTVDWTISTVEGCIHNEIVTSQC